MNIGICDNNNNCLGQAAQVVLDYTDKVDLPIDLKTFSSGTELLAYMGNTMDVLFMDIELDHQNGIEIAQKINEKWPNCQIVYLTNYIYYATDVYSTAHTFFALKEQFATRIPEIFQKVLHALSQQEAQLVFTVIGGNNVILAPNEILYFERMKRTTVIMSTRGQYVIWDKISDIAAILPTLDFVRCHNSYIVYLPAVREMQKHAFIMSNGVSLVISRSYAKQTKEAFTRWSLTQIS